MSDEIFSEQSFQVNMERSHARLVSVNTDGGGEEFAALVLLYYLCWYLLVVLLF